MTIPGDTASRSRRARTAKADASSPEPLRTEHVLTLEIRCDAPVSIGSSSHGKRQLIPITGGSFAGPRLNGTVLPGGADWQLVRADGVLEIDARYTLRTNDGHAISVRNRGIVAKQLDDADANGRTLYVRTSPSFEAPNESPHAWLNRSIFVGTLRSISGPGAIQVRVSVFRVL